MAAVELAPLTADNLEDLLGAAVADADPEEVMPPVAGSPGWNEARRDAFRRFHRSRALAPEPGEAVYVITVDGRAAGAARITPIPSQAAGSVEIGIWIGRSHRGRGVGRQATAGLVVLARQRGATRIVASTNATNIAAQRLLQGVGATITATDGTLDAELRPGP